MAHFAKPWFRKGRGWFLEVNGKSSSATNAMKRSTAITR